MALDKETKKEMDRMRNRMLDFNPEIQSVAPTNVSDVKGVDNAHVYLSAGVPQMTLRVNGVNWRLAMTSAY